MARFMFYYKYRLIFISILFNFIYEKLNNYIYCWGYYRLLGYYITMEGPNIPKSLVQKWKKQRAEQQRKNRNRVKKINSENVRLALMFRLAKMMQKTRIQNIQALDELQYEIDAGNEIYLKSKKPRLYSLHLYRLQTYDKRRAIYHAKKLLDDQREVFRIHFPESKFNEIPPGVYPYIGTYKRTIERNSGVICQLMRMRMRMRMRPAQ